MIQPAAEDFLQACGASSPPVVEVEHPERRERARQRLALPFALIGRDERADIRLDAEEISPRHAYLQVVAGQLWCIDLGSRTGTHGKNREQFAEPLFSRQSFRIGSYLIRRVDETASDEDSSVAPANPLTSDADDPSLLPRLALEIRGGAARSQMWSVDRPLTLIGRASFCKVRLHSPQVARAHAALVNTPSGPWLIDLLSREGMISIQGTAVRWARLEPEDEIRIDPFRIRLRYLAPPTRALEARSRPTDPAPALVNSSLPALVPPASVALLNGNESLLLPLITQFSLMQQQMFDQFQQTLLLMAQTFGNLHQGQMALVRQELDHIQDLTRQLQALQVESTRPAPTPPPAPSAPQSRPLSSESSLAVKPTASTNSGAAPPSSTPRGEGDVHTWLAQRLAALQQERQTRWQKLLGLLAGK